jgi:hypothetical protein
MSNLLPEPADPMMNGSRAANILVGVAQQLREGKYELKKLDYYGHAEVDRQMRPGIGPVMEYMATKRVHTFQIVVTEPILPEGL